LAIALFLVALAGPRSVLEEANIKAEGIDIVLALDTSGTMAAEDFEIQGERYTRLGIVKKVVKEFVNARSNDRIAIVAFAGRAYTVSPMTTDYSWLKANLDRIELGIIEDGTAIGSAISSSMSRLQKSKAKSKVVILLTDGMNNAGKINPLEAAKAAQALGIKIYTIGVGSKGLVPFPVQDPWGRKFYQQIQVNIDEELLRQIASLTDGKYYRATDAASLQQIYHEIDSLEKTEADQPHYRQYKEFFGFVLLAGLLFLFVETILKNTLLRKVP
jgi:Ca-activated chloride channel family protein